MTVYLPKDCRRWQHNFTWPKKRYAGSTGLSTNRKDAERWEEKVSAGARAQGGQTRAAWPGGHPSVRALGERLLRQRCDARHRPERVEDPLRVVLRFWGARPSGRDPKNPLALDR